MKFVLAQVRRSASATLAVLTALLLVAPSLVRAQGTADSEVGGESRDFRSVRSGRWVDLSTWQVFRSGVWIPATREVGVPNGASNVFIETNHTIIATRAATEVIQWNGSQAWAFLEVNNLHINTAASITTTWGSVIGGFRRDAAGNVLDTYDGDGNSYAPGNLTRPSLGSISWELSLFSPGQSNLAAQLPGGTLGGYPFNRIGNRDVYSAPNPLLEPNGGNVPTPRNMELRVYGKLRYYAGSALDRTDRDANIQVTAATIGTGSTIVFRGVSRVITEPQEWSTTLATQTGRFDNTAQTAALGTGGLQLGTASERLNNFRGLMGRNSFWTAIFDLGRVVDRNFSVDQFTGPTDDPSTAVGRIQGNFTAGIIQVRRGTLRFEGQALLANEGAPTSGSIQIMNNAVLQMVSGNIGRTAVALPQFANAYAGTSVIWPTWGTPPVNVPGPMMNQYMFPQTPSGPFAVTSRMRYFVVEEGGALDFVGVVGTLSAADVRFNGTVIYSRTGDQTLVGDSPYLSYNPAGTIIQLPISGENLNCGENGIFDPYNNNLNAPRTDIPGDPRPGTLGAFGTAPAGLGVGTAALFQPSTTAAYSHLVLRGSGTKFLIATTVTISRALIIQGEARIGLQQVSGDGVQVQIMNNMVMNGVLPYYLQQPIGGELAVTEGTSVASRAGFFPPLVYLRGTGLTGLRQENNIGTTLRATLGNGGVEADRDPLSGAIPQPMWSVYGGNTDPVIFVGFTTASTRPIFYDQDMYPEGQSYPVGMVLSGSLNREQVDMSPWNKPAVVHGLPAEPSYAPYGTSLTHNHGWTARGYTYGPTVAGGDGSIVFLSQTLDGARRGQVIRQTPDRVNGLVNAITGYFDVPAAETPNASGVNGGNIIAGFPMITNSLFDYAINTTATTTLQYDGELADVMTQIEFPQGVVGPHNLVINVASNVSLNLPIRTADYRRFDEAGIMWNMTHLNFLNKTSTLFGATAGTIIIGPEYVNSTNGNLPRHAFNPTTGLYQASAIYNQGGYGRQITPGVLASAYIDTRPDEAIVSTKILDRYYTTGVGVRPSVTLTGTFDGRVRTGFPTQRVVAPRYDGLSYVAYITSGLDAATTGVPGQTPWGLWQDFGRRGDYNNFGVLELRRGNLNIPNRNIEVVLGAPGTAPVRFNYTFVMSSAAIISQDQRNVTAPVLTTTGNPVENRRVGVGHPDAQVCLSEATGAERYPSFTQWRSWGVRNAAANPGVTTPAVVRGPAGPDNLAGTLVGGSLSNIVFTGGTGGTLAAGIAFYSPLGTPTGVTYPRYGAISNENNGLTELSSQLGILGLQTLSPFSVTNRYNAGPELFSEAESRGPITYGRSSITNQVALAYKPLSGNNQVFPGASSAIPASTSFQDYIFRANNAWNIDLPYVRNGLQHVTFLRATSNVLTLVGNRENVENGFSDGVTSLKPEDSGLQVYGTIATARGDIDLNGRNIELGGNNSMLVEAFERAQYVDSLSGRPFWTREQVGMPFALVTTQYRTGDPTPAYPSRPSTVLNNHRSVRAYIGLTSGRNVQAMNQSLGIQQVQEEPGGLGAEIYQTANPAQFRIRRWQTRGNGVNGAVTTRPGVRGADRYWQIETTGTMEVTMARSELRLQYVDTDLNNENGTQAGLPPASINIFRARGIPFVAPNSPDIRPFQALFAQQLVGLDSYNFVKQLTITGPTQIVSGVTVLNTGNFAAQSNTPSREPDITNPQTPGAGFQIWAISVPAPRCITLRGQRFLGRFGERAGAGSDFPAAGLDITGFPRPFAAIQDGGGISQTTAEQFGNIIGPFKAGFATNATIIADLLDEFGNIATTNFTARAALVVGQVGTTVDRLDASGNLVRGEVRAIGPWNTPVPQLFQNNRPNEVGYPDGRIVAIAGSGGVGGRFEWPNVRLDGIASTTVTFSVSFIADTSVGSDVPLNITFCDNVPVQVSLQGGFPFSVTFATQNANNVGATRLYPGAQGPFAAPGRVAAQPGDPNSGYDGSILTNLTGVPVSGVVVGQTVSFPYVAPGYSSITVIVKDRFGNYASFPTTATISIAGGTPPVDQLRTPLVGQQATSVVTWGLGNLGLEVSGPPQLATPGIPRTATAQNAPLQTGTQLITARAAAVSPALAPTGLGYPPFNNPQIALHIAQFPNFQIWGATSSNVTLVVATTNSDPNAPIGVGAPGNTAATIHIVPGPAIGIAPVLIPDIYNNNQLDRMPSRMFIGRSNAADPRTWFYVQAVDQFGNRVDNGPNAYNGGTATIRFATPQQGLPFSTVPPFQFTASNDPYVKVNNQAYTATGTSAVAVNGLFTFNNFVPNGPASIDPMGRDVVLTFQDPGLPGISTPLSSGAVNLFRPIPPITTATTTFLPVPVVSFSVPESGTGAPANGAVRGGVNILVLRERARTFISGGNEGLESGALRVSRAATQAANAIAVGYTVGYFNANNALNPVTFALNRSALVPLPNVGTEILQLPAPLPAGVVTTPPFPTPTPVAINGLQGDLSPRTRPRDLPEQSVNVTPPGQPATFFLPEGVNEQLVNFTARFSDQSWPRNPGIQGIRLAILQLLPPDAQNATIYDVNRMGGVDSGFVALLDPTPVPPVIMNAIQDKQLLRPTGMTPTEDRIELESPQWRPDNRPGFVFYDDNYDPMTYTATSSDPSLVSVQIRPLDRTVVGGDTDPRPTLYYAVQPGAPADRTVEITVVANDGTARTGEQQRLATDRFNVTIRNSITSVAVDPATIGFSVAPNPTVDRFTVTAKAQKTGVVSIKVINVLGQVVRSVDLNVHAGQVYSQEIELSGLPTAQYTVQINDGVSSATRQIIKN
ncbi:MAG: T9SS type A sorting domain-containing protein [Candidatus Kapabacteria bacterium]|nr:T9SS type A sorting domain-containing protein [Candidatus Kapabacteria bacterium]